MNAYIYGNVDSMNKMLNAIKSTTSSMEELFALGVLIGGVFALMQSKGDILFIVKWIMAGVLIKAAFFTTYSSKYHTLKITNAYNPTEVKVINQLPLGLVLPISIITTIDFAIAKIFSTNFTSAGGLGYLQKGGFGGQYLLEQNYRNAKITETTLKSDLKEYFEQCVNYPSALKLINLETSKDIWKDLNPTTINTVSRLVKISGTVTGCQSAYTNLTTRIDNEKNTLTQQIDNKTKKISGLSVTNLSNLKNAMKIHTSGQDNIRQLMMINEYRSDISSVAKATGVNQQALAYAQAKAQYSQTINQLNATLKQREMLPTMKNAFLVFFAGMTFIIAFIALAANKPTALNQLVIVHLWLMLWTPATIIVDYMFYGLIETTPNNPFSLEGAASYNAELSETMGVFGYILMSIPILTYQLAKGGEMAFASMTSGLSQSTNNSVNSASKAISESLSPLQLKTTGVDVAGKGSISQFSTTGQTEEITGDGKYTQQKTTNDGITTIRSSDIQTGSSVTTSNDEITNATLGNTGISAQQIQQNLSQHTRQQVNAKQQAASNAITKANMEETAQILGSSNIKSTMESLGISKENQSGYLGTLSDTLVKSGFISKEEGVTLNKNWQDQIQGKVGANAQAAVSIGSKAFSAISEGLDTINNAVDSVVNATGIGSSEVVSNGTTKSNTNASSFNLSDVNNNNTVDSRGTSRTKSADTTPKGDLIGIDSDGNPIHEKSEGKPKHNKTGFIHDSTVKTKGTNETNSVNETDSETKSSSKNESHHKSKNQTDTSTVSSGKSRRSTQSSSQSGESGASLGASLGGGIEGSASATDGKTESSGFREGESIHDSKMKAFQENFAQALKENEAFQKANTEMLQNQNNEASKEALSKIKTFQETQSILKSFTDTEASSDSNIFGSNTSLDTAFLNWLIKQDSGHANGQSYIENANGNIHNAAKNALSDFSSLQGGADGVARQRELIDQFSKETVEESLDTMTDNRYKQGRGTMAHKPNGELPATEAEIKNAQEKLNQEKLTSKVDLDSGQELPPEGSRLQQEVHANQGRVINKYYNEKNGEESKEAIRQEGQNLKDERNTFAQKAEETVNDFTKKLGF